MRLMTGVVSAQEELQTTLIGDASLSKRPMKRVAEPLRLMGADIEGDTAPLTINGKTLKAIDYQSPVASAQIKSCVLFAGLRAKGTTWISEPEQSRDHTERMLTALGVKLVQIEENRYGIEGGQTWGAFRFNVPADISSASFWAVLATCVGNGQVRLTDVGLNPTRTGLLDVLLACGSKVSAEERGDELGEPVGDITVSGGGELVAFDVGGSLVPRLIDEIPVLAVLATQCRGTTVFRDAKELRVKESDRIALVADGLTRMGAKVETFEDGFSVHGPVDLLGAEIDAHGDHRIAMAFAVAGMLASGETTLTGTETIATSYPNFWSDRDKVVLV
ncbi:MAG: 3-phosphoshikimate 1-carboxyvinyltransferase [Armatimonadota bacterium]